MKTTILSRGPNSNLLQCAISAFWLCALAIAFSANANADDVDTLRNRLYNDLRDNFSHSSAGSYLNSQNSNGSWSDIDYDQNTQSYWSPQDHLKRLLQMSVAYRKSGSGYTNSTTMRNAIRNGLDYWYAEHPVNTDNGWSNVIGGPEIMAHILVLMEGAITSSQLSQGYNYCHGEWSSYDSITSSDYVYKDSPATGQNLLWLAGIHIYISSLDAYHDANALDQAFSAIGNAIKYNENTEYLARTGNHSYGGVLQEGIREDFSFNQHGRMLQNAFYGTGFQEDFSYWFGVGGGLSFGIDSSTSALFSSLILDGTQWMIRNGVFDNATAGRSLGRPGQPRDASRMIAVCDRMIDGGFPRASEFQAFKNHLNGNDDDSLVGNKHFWKGDYQSHRREDYMVGIKMVSRRSLSHEAGNGENLQGKYLSQGMTWITMDGLEYDDIYPVWDWGRIPGTTSRHLDPAPKPANWVDNPGTTDFVGGVSDGVYGVAAYDMNWDYVSGKKAWFSFDDEVVCIGEGFSSVSGAPIYTSINQCLRDGTAYVEYGSGSGSSLGTTGGTVLSNPKWVHHDNVGYVFPASADVNYRNTSQSGSWNEINSGQSSATVTKNVFSLWIDHGVRPSTASYEYIIVPAKSKSEIQSYSNNLPITIIANNQNQMAVRHNGLGIAGVVFYQPGTVQIRPGLSVQCDSKMIVMIDESSSPVKVWCSNPEQTDNTATITLSGDINDTLNFSLPTVPYAGQSMMLTANGGGVSNQAPNVSFSTPSNGASIEAQADLSVVVSASDTDGDVASVDLYLNDVFVRQELIGPYEWGSASPEADSALLSLGVGSYDLKAIATDDDGATTEVIITINVTGAGSSTAIDGSGNVTFGDDYTGYDDQDFGGTTTIGGSETTASLTGNNWKKFPINYNVTANTVLEFTVEASDTGEIIGVGLDENNDMLDNKRVFQVGGSQSWGDGYPITPTYIANSGAATYSIDVGSYYSGAMVYLVLAADDDNNASTSVTFSDIRIYEAGSGVTSIDGSGNITLGEDDMDSYADQDESGTTSINGAGTSATLTGNNWKRFPLSYTVTGNTMLEFTINASDAGEIIGMGLEDNNLMTDLKRVFQVGGSQSWVDGYPITPSYTTGSGDATYTINVGSYYTGAMSWIVLAADDDGNASTNVTISDIKIYEQVSSVESSEDTYARDGISANTNYGSEMTLRVKDVNYTNYRRRSFIKFPVSSLVGASSVDLVLHVNALGTEGPDDFLVEIHQCAVDSWDEDTLTWSNQPSAGTLITSLELTSADVGNSVVIDVSSYVASEASGDGVASFILVQPNDTDRLIEFSSWESGNGPMLESN